MAAKKGNSSKKQTKKNTEKVSSGQRQVMSVVLFGVSLFLLAVVFIKGENFWAVLHDFFFGIFGVLTYLFPIFLLVVSVLYALEKLGGSLSAKIAETAIIVVLIDAAIDIFSKHNLDETFFEHLSNAYIQGANLKSGGFIGALIGEPIYRLFGNPGAAITVIILIFIFLMLMTGTTLISLFKNIAKPVQKIGKSVEESYQTRMEEEIEEKPKKHRVNVDVPIDDPIIPKTKPSNMKEKQLKLINTYNDEELDIKDLIDEEGNSVTVEEALKAAEEERNAHKEEGVYSKSSDKPVETEDITIPMEQQEDYKFPPITLLNGATSSGDMTKAELENTAERLVNALRSFGVETRVVDISRGPTVTRYELQPSAGVKISKITNLADDIALNLATAGVRIEAPIPNKAAVGIEVPNKASNVVRVREILESSSFAGSKSKLTVALGKDIGGNAIVTDIAKMPHGLIAGATGSGKSVCINSIIMSILYKAKPDEVKLIMIDPKVVELGVYNGIPHLLVPVVTDPRKAAGTLGWAVSEMEKRYMMFAANNVRDIDGYNRVAEKDEEMVKMPRIVIIIDELADLMMTAPKEVEDSINRIAAKARAAGMHLIIATQRPSVDVVTGVIKANVPTRIAFSVSSQIDSRTILDTAGAEKLLGKGDMLFHPVGASKASRIQGCFVDDGEVESVVNFIKNGNSSDYDTEVMDEIERQSILEKKERTGVSEGADDADPMLEQAIEVVVEMGQASTSMLQRKLKLGYARAARLVDEMEERGIVGPYEGAKPRQVLITMEQLLERKAGEE